MCRRKSMRWTVASLLANVCLLATGALGHPLHTPGGKRENQMNRSHLGAAIAVVVMLFASLGYGQDQASTAPPTNDAIIHHMEALEEQVKELRAEVATLKGSDKTAAAAAATVPVPAQSNLVSGTTSAAPAGPSLAGLLGPTSLSGFVDVYYGTKLQQPCSTDERPALF